MTAVDLLTIRLTWAEDMPVRPAAHLLRGAVAGLFPNNPLFHQHEQGRVLYRHPPVQYRWDHQGPILFGIGEGARLLSKVEWPGLELRIGDRSMTVRDAVCSFRCHEIRPSERLLRYRFMAPWLPLNQENYRRYQSLTPIAQEQERDRLAIAGLLVTLRGFGVEFPVRLYAAFDLHTARPCPYKGVDLLGFCGRLLTNVDLPDGFALGRAVSHGYGWLCRADSPLSARGHTDD